jgi:hypothetical protein
MSGFAEGYIDVATRIRELREKHPDASLQPLDLNRPFQIVEMNGELGIIYVAACYRTPDDPRPGIGMAWEPVPGRTPYTKGSELMVAETSAWGRAIVAAMAADTRAGIASADEVAAASGEKPRQARQEGAGDAQRSTVGSQATPATENQERALYAISKKLSKLPPAKGTLTKVEAGNLIEKLQQQLEAQNASEPEEEPF